MVTVLSFERFDGLYQQAVREVSRFCTPDVQTAVAAHCHGWSPGMFDFPAYLRASSVRFYRAYRSFADRGPTQAVCDVGGFWGVFAVTLRSLGYTVTLTESLQYYGDSFSDLFGFIERRGVTIVDCNLFQPGAALPGPFDVVTVMAVLEHYPHSLESFMANVRALMKPTGCVYIEVPNIAYWPKRMGLLHGRTPLVPIGVIYKSKKPFVGHHHEFTIAELRDLADLSGLRIVEESFYTYSPQGGFFERLQSSPVGTLAQVWFPKTREVLAVACERRAGKNGAT